MILAVALLVSRTATAQMKSVAGVPLLRLNNGVDMPQFGIGTYGIPNDSVAADAVCYALKNGYRHIDTAHAYNDEDGVGEGIRRSGVPREQI